jgi:hypothetical protein
MVDVHIGRRLDLHSIPMCVDYDIALLSEWKSLSGLHNFLKSIHRILLGLLKSNILIDLFASFGNASTKMIDVVLGIWNYYSIEGANHLEHISVKLVEASPLDLVLANESSQEEVTESSDSSNGKRKLSFIGIYHSVRGNVPLAMVVPHLDERAINLFLDSSCIPIDLGTVAFSIVAKLVKWTANYFKSGNVKDNSTAFTNHGNVEVRADLIVLEQKVITLFLQHDVVGIFLD